MNKTRKVGVYCLSLCLLGVLTAGTFSAEKQRPKKQNKTITDPTPAQKLLYSPSPNPDHIVLSWYDDPATSMGVTWRSDANATTGYVEYVVSEDGPLFPKKAQRIKAETVPLDGSLGAALYHSGKLTVLQPHTLYAYRVGDGDHWSEWNQFTTATSTFAPFSFIYFGDAQNDIKTMWSRVIRQAYRDAPKAAFLLYAGDLTNTANSDVEWGELFEAGTHIHRMIPCVPTPGNHEYANKRLSIHWRAQFALPENGVPGLEETNYWIDHQQVRLISLNSNEHIEEQTQWLRQTLQNNPNRWTILTFHHPIYSSAKGRDNAELRQQWQPLFDRYRVDLVLQGHDHTYARSHKLAGAKTPTGITDEDQAGTVYVVSVSGPKMYKISQQPFMARMGQDLELYQVIHVEYDTLRYEAHTATGRVYDAFALRKRPGQTNELINEIPTLP